MYIVSTLCRGECYISIDANLVIPPYVRRIHRDDMNDISIHRYGVKSELYVLAIRRRTECISNSSLHNSMLGNTLSNKSVVVFCRYRPMNDL